jgi:hypothetical protein
MRIVHLASPQRWTAHFLHEPTGRLADITFSLNSNENRVTKAFEEWRRRYPDDRWKGKQGTGDGWVFRSPAFTYGWLI